MLGALYRKITRKKDRSSQYKLVDSNSEPTQEKSNPKAIPLKEPPESIPQLTNNTPIKTIQRTPTRTQDQWVAKVLTAKEVRKPAPSPSNLPIRPLQQVSTSTQQQWTANASLQKEAPKPCPAFFNVPVEIIQYIATFLPPASATALSLCSHDLLRIVGVQYWKKCTTAICKQEKHNLLDLLSTDLEEYIHCHRCIILHKPDSSRLNCVLGDINSGVYYFLFNEFSFVHFQMAMKLHRLGKYPRTYLELLTRTDLKLIQFHLRPYYPLRGRLCITHEPRIDANEMIFRAQYCVLLPSSIDDLERVVYATARSRGPFWICAHISIQDSRLKHAFQCLFLYTLSGRHTFPQIPCRHLMECDYCGAEFQMDMKNYGAKGVAFVVTRWINLGAGLSPNDEKWHRFLTHSRGQKGIRLSKGDIFNRWENCRPSEFSPVLSPAQETVLFNIQNNVGWKNGN